MTILSSSIWLRLPAVFSSEKNCSTFANNYSAFLKATPLLALRPIGGRKTERFFSIFANNYSVFLKATPLLAYSLNLGGCHE